MMSRERTRDDRRHPPRRPRPWKVITTDDPNQELGHLKSSHRTLIQACNAAAKSTAPYVSIVYDNGHQRRDLTDQEHMLLHNVCHRLGVDIADA